MSLQGSNAFSFQCVLLRMRSFQCVVLPRPSPWNWNVTLQIYIQGKWPPKPKPTTTWQTMILFGVILGTHELDTLILFWDLLSEFSYLQMIIWTVDFWMAIALRNAVCDCRWVSGILFRLQCIAALQPFMACVKRFEETATTQQLQQQAPNSQKWCQVDLALLRTSTLAQTRHNK